MSGLPVISVSKLRISLPGAARANAVDDLSFTLDHGRTLAIVGETGSGKSLTALALTGLLPAEASWSGTIDLKGRDARHIIKPGMAGSDWHAIRARAVGMVSGQAQGALNPDMKLGRQLAEAIAVAGAYYRKQLRELTMEWLARVGFQDPKAMYHRYPDEITAAQRQRVLIAMAMCSQPALLIADELTANVDAIEQRDLLRLLRNLQSELGTAMIFLTRDLSLATQLADELLVLRDGQAVEYGPADDVLSAPEHPFTRALLGCRPGPEARGRLLPLPSDFEADGPDPLPQALPPVRYSGKVLLKVRHLRVWYPTQTNLFGTSTRFLRAVEDVSFDLNEGEVLGLVGESGGGKSSIGLALTGLVPVESGSMVFGDRDLAHLSLADWRRMRRDVQLIPRDAASTLDQRRTIGEAIREPLTVHRIVARKELDAEVKRILALVHLPGEVLDKYSRELSVAQLQRVGIARALALRPKLIICDECLSGLDVCAGAGILNLLKELQGALRLSYLFISHNLDIVHYMADKVIVMQEGRIVERGTAEEVLTRPKDAATRHLVEAAGDR